MLYDGESFGFPRDEVQSGSIPERFLLSRRLSRVGGDTEDPILRILDSFRLHFSLPVKHHPKKIQQKHVRLAIFSSTNPRRRLDQYGTNLEPN